MADEVYEVTRDGTVLRVVDPHRGPICDAIADRVLSGLHLLRCQRPKDHPGDHSIRLAWAEQG